MKKYLVISCCICICFLLQATKISASEVHTEVLTTDAILDQSEDKNDIKALSPEIIDFVNSSFADENVMASAENIDFSKTYCVYVDEDIFKNASLTYQQIHKLKQAAKKVWVVPIQANGRNIVAQISRAPSLHDIQRKDISEEEKQEIEKNSGKWQVVSANLYDEYSDFNLQLHEILLSQDIDGTNTKCILFGGVPGIQTVLAVLTDENSITGVVSLQRDIQSESNAITKTSSDNAILKKDIIYSFELYSDIVSEIRTNIDKADTTNTSGFHNNNRYNYGIMCVVVIASIIIVLLIIKYYLKHR